ncbi:MAG: hypothetical protein HWE37_14270 [Rhodobacteraceae bacterium]|nr:hypothetical protein [Paracoccaceae bacterium]
MTRFTAGISALVLALVPLTGPLAAQDDPMALQRCVWSCLANFGPNTNPAYHACVERVCSGLSEGEGGGGGQQQAQGDPTRGWVTGRTGSGVGYAGVDGVRGKTGLYYFCGRGQSFLRVIGIDGGERGMIVEVDGQQFPLRFSPNGQNQPESTLAYSDPVIQALQGGSRVRVLTYDGPVVVDAPLSGSSRALAQVISSC